MVSQLHRIVEHLLSGASSTAIVIALALVNILLCYHTILALVLDRPDYFEHLGVERLELGAAGVRFSPTSLVLLGAAGTADESEVIVLDAVDAAFQVLGAEIAEIRLLLVLILRFAVAKLAARTQGGTFVDRKVSDEIVAKDTRQYVLKQVWLVLGLEIVDGILQKALLEVEVASQVLISASLALALSLRFRFTRLIPLVLVCGRQLVEGLSICSLAIALHQFDLVGEVGVTEVVSREEGGQAVRI